MTMHDIETGVKQYRAAKIQDFDPTKRELVVKAVPYGVTADIGGGITETFAPGAFKRAAKAVDRLKVWNNHHGPMVGNAVEAEDRPDGFWIRARISRSQAGQEMLGDIEDGILTDPSIEFRPMKDYMKVTRTADGFDVVHTRAHLVGFAMVAEGAYAGSAYVESVRDARRERAAEEARAWFLEWQTRRV